MAAHLLVLHFLPDLRPPEIADQDQSLPITLFPVRLRRPSASGSQAHRHLSHAHMAALDQRKASRSKHAQLSTPTVIGSGQPRLVRPWVDWEREADAAIDDSAARAAEAAHRASALSRWREHVLPGPPPPEPPFRWDYAATHRFTPTLSGLVVALSDRCSLLISPFAVLPGCAIGHIPVYGDLFAHMDDPRPPGDSSVPQLR